MFLVFIKWVSFDLGPTSSLKNLKFVKLWFISVWYTSKVAAGRRICWRKKWSTFLKNRPNSSISYIYNSSIIATVTLLELPCCFSPCMKKLCRTSLAFRGRIFKITWKKCPNCCFAVEIGLWHRAVSGEIPEKQSQRWETL